MNCSESTAPEKTLYSISDLDFLVVPSLVWPEKFAMLLYGLALEDERSADTLEKKRQDILRRDALVLVTYITSNDHTSSHHMMSTTH